MGKVDIEVNNLIEILNNLPYSINVDHREEDTYYLRHDNFNAVLTLNVDKWIGIVMHINEPRHTIRIDTDGYGAPKNNEKYTLITLYNITKLIKNIVSKEFMLGVDGKTMLEKNGDEYRLWRRRLIGSTVRKASQDEVNRLAGMLKPII